MKRILGIAASFSAALALTACGTSELDQARTIKPTGDDFTSHLARYYRDLAVYEADDMYDWPDAVTFAQKANLAADGKVVLPEDPNDWSIPHERRQELMDAHQRLRAVLDDGGRTEFPALAATAQTKYDCWVEQAEENWQFDHISSCRDEFILALEAMEQPVATAPPPVLVFFDWDSAELQDAAVPIIDRLAAALRRMPEQELVIEGHADTSGARDYNRKLSMRRAETVAEALSRRGVDRDRITLIAKGEEELRVPTDDGVREPQNRRVRIQAKGPEMAMRTR